MKKNIVFLTVLTNVEKLTKIATVINDILRQGKKILILVPHQQAADYLDKYLWQASEESFIPHSIANAPTNEHAAITTLQENVNGATVLLNLTSGISFSSHFETIYELDDQTT